MSPRSSNSSLLVSCVNVLLRADATSITSGWLNYKQEHIVAEVDIRKNPHELLHAALGVHLIPSLEQIQAKQVDFEGISVGLRVGD